MRGRRGSCCAIRSGMRCAAENHRRASASSPDAGGCAGWLVRSAEDRLSLIAERTLGDASRWPEIAELNDIALRGGSYRVGDCLKLPPG